MNYTYQQLKCFRISFDWSISSCQIVNYITFVRLQMVADKVVVISITYWEKYLEIKKLYYYKQQVMRCCPTKTPLQKLHGLIQLAKTSDDYVHSAIINSNTKKTLLTNYFKKALYFLHTPINYEVIQFSETFRISWSIESDVYTCIKHIRKWCNIFLSRYRGPDPHIWWDSDTCWMHNSQTIK